MADEVVWVVVAGALLVGELFTLDLILIMFSVAALLSAGVAALGGNLIAQLVVFAVASTGLTLGLRPVARRHLQQGPELRTGTEALVGARAEVLERVDGRDGRVRLAGEVWSARSFPDTDVLDVGATVLVLRIEGARAVVCRSEPNLPPGLDLPGLDPPDPGSGGPGSGGPASGGPGAGGPVTPA
ncbi:Membrane protein implicated in regulation of membrane protease activity [Parafrankia irregularis]|uniref:Membrane protein implicated in regulation of membrane protease activity n=1 Tax=Parafrankia irregularis TaxID=795642 RepID=A0A0S4QKP5_9ACTN|nr:MULTISPECIES: NfeD family protein [Parafrankia]MBE3202027.1 NfeD family protein [Parafrankia sp. CH37]CUU55801.1 Membrane protein implicated in regulation of membrane protease activity [Parafrankia irregularis]